MDELLKEDQETISLLSTVPGVDKKAATKIVAETRINMYAFATEKHLAKWAGICPGNNESGGKKKAQEPPTATNKIDKAISGSTISAGNLMMPFILSARVIVCVIVNAVACQRIVLNFVLRRQRLMTNKI